MNTYSVIFQMLAKTISPMLLEMFLGCQAIAAYL